MKYFFTSESVGEGHPDKIADQISDVILDNYLFNDKKSRVACETLVTTNQVILAGEIKSNATIDTDKIIRDTIKKIGYNKDEYLFSADTTNILNLLHGQSPDISQGVDKADTENQGAGDQGIMFGYATSESKGFIPLSLEISHNILKVLAELRKIGKIGYLRPDSKSQVTIEYKDGIPVHVDTLVLSTQHDNFDTEEEMLKTIEADVRGIVLDTLFIKYPEYRLLFTDKTKYHINPTGKFIIGGPHGDSGLTGRKIIVDTYGGRGAHGGGALSGKDSSKVDRSAAYMARYIAKNLVAAGVAKECLIQLSYAIGVAKPVGIFIDTYGTSPFTNEEITKKVEDLFDLRPYYINKRLKLDSPIYSETASYGHFGRESMSVVKTFIDSETGESRGLMVELFPWEKLDAVDEIKKAFRI